MVAAATAARSPLLTILRTSRREAVAISDDVFAAIADVVIRDNSRAAAMRWAKQFVHCAGCADEEEALFGVFPVRETCGTAQRQHDAMPALATLPFASLAEKSDVDVDTLRRYERLGLLSKPRRPANGFVLYPADEALRVTFIKRSFELGFSADAIRDMVSLGRARQKSCKDIYAIAERQLADIRRRIDDLARIERTLAPLVESCPQRGGVADCSIVNALSHPPAGSQGSHWKG